MNLEHAAALALIGWYLMMLLEPAPGTTPNLSLPLSKWWTLGSYDTAAQCERVRLTIIDQESPEMRFIGALMLRCIATDDPRLKGN
jgi:hypothetical protein